MICNKEFVDTHYIHLLKSYKKKKLLVRKREGAWQNMGVVLGWTIQGDCGAEND